MSKKLTIEFILNKTNNNNPKNIRALNLWSNNISDISVLSEFPSLEIISLVGNQINDISVFKKLKNVRELYLKDNQINDWNQIENLRNCKKLEKLVLKDNPISKYLNYPKKVLEILPQLKKIDELEVKQLKMNPNFNSPLMKNDLIQNNNNYNIQSPISKNKSESESISSDRKSDSKNDSAAPDPQTSIYNPHIQNNINENNNIYNSNNFNNGINMINTYKDYNAKLNNNIIHQKDKSELLNISFKKKITEGSFRKVVKNSNNLNNKIFQEEKNKALISRAVNNDNKLKNEKMSQTVSSGFYQNPFKNNNDPAVNEIGGYRKKIISNFKQEQEHKENNKNKQNVINTVFNKYQYFDNDNENEEEKRKSSETPKKNIFKKFNNAKPLMTSNKKISSMDKKIITSRKNISLNENENKAIKNGMGEPINKSVVESIKLLMSTLSVDGLKQIQNDVQKLIESKNIN